jgi:hypothetical protein
MIHVNDHPARVTDLGALAKGLCEAVARTAVRPGSRTLTTR